MYFSVIVPVYNSAKTIRRCLDSILVQDFSDYEIIIVDDGSNDESSIILDEYKHFDNIRVFNQQNKGAGSARNIGILNAKGNYLIFVDSDDYISNDYMKSVYNRTQLDKSDVIYFDFILVRENGDKKKISLKDYFKKEKMHLIASQITGKLPWGAPRKVVKRQLLIDYSISFSNTLVAEELIYTFKIMQHSTSISYINQPLYFNTISNSSLSKKGGVEPWKNMIDLFEKYLATEKLFSNYEISLNSLKFTSWIISLIRTIQTDPINFSSYYIKSNSILKDKFMEVNTRILDFRVYIAYVLYKFGLLRLILKFYGLLIKK